MCIRAKLARVLFIYPFYYEKMCNFGGWLCRWYLLILCACNIFANFLDGHPCGGLLVWFVCVWRGCTIQERRTKRTSKTNEQINL